MKKLIAILSICLLCFGVLASCGEAPVVDFNKFFTVGTPTLAQGTEQNIISIPYSVTNYGKNEGYTYVVSIDGKINDFTLEPVQTAKGGATVACELDATICTVETVFTVISDTGETIWQKIDSLDINISDLEITTTTETTLAAYSINWVEQIAYDSELDPSKIFEDGLYDVCLDITNPSDEPIFCMVTSFAINDVAIQSDLLVASTDKEIPSWGTGRVNVRLGSELTATTGQTEVKKFAMGVQLKDGSGKTLYKGDISINY